VHPVNLYQAHWLFAERKQPRLTAQRHVTDPHRCGLENDPYLPDAPLSTTLA